jgi:hypothetical protein
LTSSNRNCSRAEREFEAVVECAVTPIEFDPAELPRLLREEIVLRQVAFENVELKIRGRPEGSIRSEARSFRSSTRTREGGGSPRPPQGIMSM